MADLLSSLPDGVLKLVMQHVPLKDRLTSCCLVNKTLHAAAVAFEDLVLGDWRNISATFPDFQDCVFSWLHHYGHHLTRLRLSRFPKPLKQLLPCPNLLDLSLASDVDLRPAAGGQLGMFQGCTKLTRLVLERGCNVFAPSSGVVDSLESLVHLQHLDVWPVNLYAVAGLSLATLPALSQLTYLLVKRLFRQNLAQLGGLTNLQELHLHATEDQLALGPSRIPGLVFPASLTKLVLMQTSVEAGLLSLLPAGLKVLSLPEEVEGPAEGPGSLLACVARLEQLTKLELYSIALPPAGPAYSALTASSSLASLLVPQDCMPEGVWPHVFPASRTLLHFTCLHFVAFDPETVLAPWASADVSRLVSCCPNLRKVQDITLLHGPHVSELRKLTCLTSLAVSFDPEDIPAAEQSLKGLAAVTQLRDLTVTMEQYLTFAAMVPLTHVTSLTHLGIHYNREDGWSPADELEFRQAGPAPNVWQQLLERCAAEPGCQPLSLAQPGTTAG